MVLENISQNKWNSESNVSKNTPEPCASNFSDRVKKLIQKYEDLSVSAKNNNLQSVNKCSSEQNISRRHSEMFSDTNISLNNNHVYRFLSLDNNENTKSKYIVNGGENDNISTVYSVNNNCDTKMPSHSKKSAKPKLYIDKSFIQGQQNEGSSTGTKRKEKKYQTSQSINEPEKDKKHNNSKKTYTYEKSDQQYDNSLPPGKKKSFGKNFIRSFSASTSRDKKSRPLSSSNQQYEQSIDKKLKTTPKDGNSIIETQSSQSSTPQENSNIGAVNKQLTADGVIYRKRRDSYIMATQTEENHRKLKIYPDSPTNKQSYVSKTISKFETKTGNDIMNMVNIKTEQTKQKVENEIIQLLKKYNDNKKFGTSNKMTREELSLEIDNVLLNKFKQISSDSSPETRRDLSVENHNNSQQVFDDTPQHADTITLVVQQEQTSDSIDDIQTEYVIILEDPANRNSNVDSLSQGDDASSELNLEQKCSVSESDLNVREKLSAEFNKVLSNNNMKESFKGSVENLFEDIDKDLSALNRSLCEIGVEISSISMSIDSEEENMIGNMDCNRTVSCPNNIYSEEKIYENLKYIEEKIREKSIAENNPENNPENKDAELILPTDTTSENIIGNNTKQVYVSQETEIEEQPAKKVSNLVEFFSEIITSGSVKSTEDNKRSPQNNRKTSISSTSTYICDEVFNSPTVSTTNCRRNNFNSTFSSGTSSTSSEGIYDEIKSYETYPHIQKSPTIKVSCIDDCLKQNILQNNEENLSVNTSFKTNETHFQKSPTIKVTCIDDCLKQNILQNNEENLSTNTSPKTNHEENSTSNSYLYSQKSLKKNEESSSHRSSQNSKTSENLPRRSSLYNSFRSNASSEEKFDFLQYIHGNMKNKKAQDQTQSQNVVKDIDQKQSQPIKHEKVVEKQKNIQQNDTKVNVVPKRQHSFNSDLKSTTKEQIEQLQSKQNVNKRHSFNSHRRDQDKLSAKTGNKQTGFSGELKNVHKVHLISSQERKTNEQTKQTEQTIHTIQPKQIEKSEHCEHNDQSQNEHKNNVHSQRRNDSFSSQNSSQEIYDHSQDSSQNDEETKDFKPRFSRLYSSKFYRSYSTKNVKEDTNNNECTNSQTTEIHKIESTFDNKSEGTEESSQNAVKEVAISDKSEDNDSKSTIETINSNAEIDQNIYDTINQDVLFYSESEGDYDLTEAYNDTNTNFMALERDMATNEWVQNTIDRIKMVQDESFEDFDEEEDTEHIYERIKRSGSTMTIYDDQNNPAIRLSMIDIIGDFPEVRREVEDKKIEESEKVLRKSIEEILDNSRKACLINELITTEKNYIYKSLHRLVNDYMPEMDKADIPKSLAGKCRQIFGNADMIFEGHREKFLPALENHTTIEELADSFLNHETIFKLYPLYSKNKPKSDVVMRDHNFYFKTKQDALNDKLDLQSYLLTPIQRLAKYCLLVRSLVKECEKENIACEKLKSALEMLNKQMRLGNDLIALDSVVGYNGCIRDHGEVLLRDTFMVQPPNKKPAYEGMIYLFQECLIITAVLRQDYKETFLYKENFQLTDMGYSDIDTEPLEFSVWYRKRDIKMYRFRTKNQDLKQKWVKEIFNLLWKQLEANKKRIKKENEEKGVKDTRVPVTGTARPYSVPNKGKSSPSSGYSSTKSTRKRTLNSSADTIWYAVTS